MEWTKIKEKSPAKNGLFKPNKGSEKQGANSTKEIKNPQEINYSGFLLDDFQ